MSTARVANRALSGLRSGTSQHLRKPSAPVSATPVRAISSTSQRSTKSSLFAAPSSCNATQRLHELTQAIRISPARRGFSTMSAKAHSDWEPPKPGGELYVTFIDKEGDEHKLAVSKGDNLLTIAQANDIEMEGACEGSCSCSTCHVIVEDEELYDKIPEASDDENDMLDLAFGLTETSRLGCQIVMNEELDGLRVKLPAMTRNMQASDFEKKK